MVAGTTPLIGVKVVFATSVHGGYAVKANGQLAGATPTIGVKVVPATSVHGGHTVKALGHREQWLRVPLPLLEIKWYLPPVFMVAIQ